MRVAVIFNKPEIKDFDVINIFGMQTKERYNPKTVEMVASALEKGGHNVRVIEGNMEVDDELQNFMPKSVSNEPPGMVFNMAYGIQGQSRYTHIPAMLEMLGIPYVGSNPAGHAIALDKVMSKIIFLRHDLPTPAFWVFSGPDDDYSDVKYPVIVKPKMEAVSFGLRIVDNEKDLKDAVEFILKEFQQQALAEEFIPGREFAVGLLGNGSTLKTLPIVEIDLDGDPNAIQTIEDKMQKPRDKICPAELPEEKAEEMRKLARDAFNSLNLYDFSRVDIRMDSEGKMYLLEINSMASLGMSGSYVFAAQKTGHTYTSLVNRMLDVAAIRYFGELPEKPEDSQGKKAGVSEPLHIRVRSYLRSQLKTIESYLEWMVSINSYFQNLESVNTLGNWVSNRFQHIGFQSQVYPQSEVGNMLYFSNHNDEQNDILLIGHLDSIHDYQDFVPFYEERGRIYGSDVAESKGGLAVILAALQALRFARVLKRIRCGVLLTTDSSLGGKFSKKLIAEIAENSKYVVNTKYGDLNGGIVASCSGTRQYQIEVTNIKSSKARSSADVIAGVCQKVLLWQKLSSEEKGFQVTVNSIDAKTSHGRASDHATITLIARFEEKSRSAELDEHIRRIAERSINAKLQVQVKRGPRLLPVANTEKNVRFFEDVKTLARRLEIRIEPVHRFSSSDICFVPETVPVLDGFGPIGGDTNTLNEYVLRDSLIDRSALLALTVYHCGKRDTI